MRSVTLGLTLWILWITTAGIAAAQPPASPAKAILKIDKPPAEPLDVAVYDAGAPSFDRPLAVARGVSPAGVEIPAGDLLVALRSGRGAPDLHRLKVSPGGSARLEYRPREGWSLIVRASNARTRQPVPSAVVALDPASPETTGADGLALFSGIAAPAVYAGVRHPDFVPQTVQGIAAAPGTLTFRDVALEAGGRVRAWVRVKGQPRDGALCSLKALQSPPATPYEGKSDPQGICQTGRVPAGHYVFSVLPPGSVAPLLRGVDLKDGQELQEDFSFSEIRVHGTVTRGEDPVPGLYVRFQEQGEKLGWDRVDAFAKTGPDGAYELTLAKPGHYTAGLLPRVKSPPAVERAVEVKENEDKTVDFALRKAVIHGTIVDAQGQPVVGAWVKLLWNDLAEVSQTTDKRGEFTFFLESVGYGDLTAGGQGYQDAPVQELEVDEDTDPPSLVLVLAREGAGGPGR